MKACLGEGRCALARMAVPFSPRDHCSPCIYSRLPSQQVGSAGRGRPQGGTRQADASSRVKNSGLEGAGAAADLGEEAEWEGQSASRRISLPVFFLLSLGHHPPQPRPP